MRARVGARVRRWNSRGILWVGFRLLTLCVFAGNIHAQRIYEKAGFEQEVIKYVKAFR